MINEKEFAIEAERYLKDIGLAVVQSEVGIGKRRLRPDLVGYSLSKNGELVPEVVVEVRVDQDILKGQQQLVYYTQHLETVPYALLVTPEHKVWYDTRTFLQVEQPNFKNETEFFVKESDISNSLKNTVDFLKSLGMLPYDRMWTLCFCFFVRAYLYRMNQLSDWKKIESEDDLLLKVQLALNEFQLDNYSRKFEVKPKGLKPEEVGQLVSNLNLVPPHHEMLKKTVFSLIEDIGAQYSGSYLTPLHLRKLFAGLARQLNLVKKDVIDLSSGFGGLAFEVLDTIPVRKLTAIELHNEIWLLSYIISIINGYDNIEIYQGNSLFNDVVNNFKLEKESYSCVLIDPPLGKVVLEEEWYKNFKVTERGKRKRLEFTELFLERGIELAKDKGYILALVPEGILYNSANQITRDFIRHHTIIEAIISLPVQTLRPYSGIKLSILVLRKKKNESETASNLFIAQPNNIDDFEEVLEGFAKWKRGIL